MSGPRIVGLCEGYGGLTMGVRAVLGGDLVAYAEVKPAAVALLADRHPNVPNLGDLTVADWTGVEAEIVTAGWPCQPHSSAGKRLGEEDPRAIWPAVLDVVRVVRPTLFIGENVARVATNGELRRVVRSLAAIGYVGSWRCAPASGLVGTPHKRDRLLLVAVDAALPRAEADRRIARWAGAARELGGLGAPVGGGESGDELTLLPTPTARDHKGRGWGDQPGRPLSETVHRLLPTPTQNMTTGAGSEGRDGGLNLQTAAVQLLPTPSASSYGTNQGGSAGRVGPVRESLDTMAKRERLTADRWGVYADAIARWEAVTGEVAPDPTQPSTKAPHGPQLSPAFVEWMMGVPKGWVTDGAPGVGHDSRGRWSAPGERNAFLSLLGDGVVPQWGAAQVTDVLPVALAEARAAGRIERNPEGEVVVVADLSPTVERLLHLARNARDAGLWSETVRTGFTARKVVLLQGALVRDAKAAEDVATLKNLARRGVADGLWSDEVRAEFTACREALETQEAA